MYKPFKYCILPPRNCICKVCHDSQNNGIQHKNTQHNNKKTDTQQNETQHNETQHSSRVLLCYALTIMHSFMYAIAERHKIDIYADCRPDCHFADYCGAL